MRMLQTITPSDARGLGTRTTTLSFEPEGERCDVRDDAVPAARRTLMTVRDREGRTSTLEFTPGMKVLFGVVTAVFAGLIISAIGALLLMWQSQAVDRAENRRDLGYLTQEVASLKAQIAAAGADRYTGAQALKDHNSLLDLVRSNVSAMTSMNGEIGRLRERVAAIEADLRNGHK